MLGHSNTGKSTLCGRILLDTGLVDDRDVVSLKRDAVNNGRESWWIAYLMDQETSERKKGVTENVSRVCFSTPNRRYTLTDCGGHQKYVSLMANSVLSANLAIIIVSAIQNEFEASLS